MTRMICPQCQPAGTELKVSSRSGIEIDYCPTCRGVWLDRGELDKILDREAEYLARRPGTTPAAAGPDPDLERQRLELERKRQEVELLKQRAATELERRRHEEDFRAFEASMRPRESASNDVAAFEQLAAEMRRREDVQRRETRRPADPYREPPRRREGYDDDEGFGGFGGERGERGERGEYGDDYRGYGPRKGRRRESLLGEIFDIFGD